MTDEAAKLARKIAEALCGPQPYQDNSSSRVAEFINNRWEGEMVRTQHRIESILRTALAAKDAEIERLRELAYRVVVSSHLKNHGGLNKPNFDECRFGFCADWHDLSKPQGESHDG